MAILNENFLKLKAGYLFPEISRRIKVFKQNHADADVISMGIGDVTQPLPTAITEAMKKAVAELGTSNGFHGYGPERGYDFLANLIVQHDYKSRGVDIETTEVFISDGAKCDTANIQEIFGLENTVAVADPVYPVYVDTNVMAGRTGPSDENGRYGKIVYMPCTAENDFSPELPTQQVDLIYLCFPNNPTGAVVSKETLARWVEYAREHKAVILFDAAYEAFITEDDIPHSIYEVQGAKEVAIEFRSYSKSAGFTGVRCGYCVVPRQLKAYTKDGQAIDLNSIWNRRQGTKFNGASYISQAGAAATYSDAGKKQIQENIDIYMKNAGLIRKTLSELGYEVHGGVNAPYIWLKTPNEMTSWDFFDVLLNKAHVVGTPGAGFGAAGEGYFRLTAFPQPNNVEEALRRIAKL